MLMPNDFHGNKVATRKTVHLYCSPTQILHNKYWYFKFKVK
jgi:hypothetical protein